MVAAYKIERINAMYGRVRTTLKRSKPPMPKSLRLMAGQFIREAMVRNLQGHALIHPGIEKMAAWGECSERQARRNVRIMEDWGYCIPVGKKSGGRSAIRYLVEPESLIRLMVECECNPHPDLMAEIRDLRADMRADMNPGHKAGHMSAGSYDGEGSASQPPLQVLRGGRS